MQDVHTLKRYKTYTRREVQKVHRKEPQRYAHKKRYNQVTHGTPPTKKMRILANDDTNIAKPQPRTGNPGGCFVSRFRRWWTNQNDSEENRNMGALPHQRLRLCPGPHPALGAAFHVFERHPTRQGGLRNEVVVALPGAKQRDPTRRSSYQQTSQRVD